MILPRDGHVELFERVFDEDAAGKWFERLRHGIDWQQEELRIMGRMVAVPRLTAWYGAFGYRYSGVDHPPRPLTDDLVILQRHAMKLADTELNSVLANFYRSGDDAMGWHADNERELGEQPVIVSFSFGGTRRFSLRHRRDPRTRVDLELASGSCLVMRGETQTHWLHRIARTKKAVDPRINLTFRLIHPPSKAPRQRPFQSGS
ncbi:MAG: alpha-ketoglutarate-dependent dioxygenase AlkB [Geminicoccaceae bacterium]